MHGHNRIDNYYWLNDRENPEVLKYLEDENAYTSEVLHSTEKFQEALFNEMKGRIKEQDESVPYFYNGYWYYTRFVEGGEYPVYCRKKENLNNEENILINCNELAIGHEYFHSTGVDVSTDNTCGMFAVDTVGRRIYTLKFKNLLTNEFLIDEIPGTTGNCEWANDGKTVFYGVQDEETLRSYRIYKHVLGKPLTEDEIIYEESDETYTCEIRKTKSNEYLIIDCSSTLSTESRILNANQPSGKFKIFNSRENNHEYGIDHLNDKFYIVTNLNARNFRLMETFIHQTEKENWKELIPHRTEVLLEDIELFKDFYVLSERINGLPAIRIKKWNGDEHLLDFEEATYDAFVSVNPEINSEVLRFGFNSLVTPASTFDYNMVTRVKTLLKQQEIVGGYERSHYHSERLYANAADGTQIPISIVYRKDRFNRDGNSPLLQYGYGSYGISMDATFSSSRLSLLDRGFAFAICHIRGGQELGRQWYEDGKLLKKENTFSDFIDCSKFLIENKYTSNSKLFAMGGSAGGLLMGAIINKAPHLYKGVVAAVPFVDVVTTMLDPSIPLTTGEYDEWGNPEDKKYYDYILGYSPYDNVKAINYPNLLVTTGLHDSQVQYWEPAKWVAKLREVKTDNNILLLHTNMDAGHGGASGRFKALKELALDYTFLFMLAGVNVNTD